MEATRTYLELTTPGQFRSAFGHFPEFAIERVAHPTPELYRECYRTVGEAYHWRDRWDWTDAESRASGTPRPPCGSTRGTARGWDGRRARWRTPGSARRRTGTDRAWSARDMYAWPPWR